MKWLHNSSADLAANKSALHVGMKMIGCAGNLDKKGQVGKVLSNITNLPVRTIPSKVALSSSHSSSTHQSFEPDESASINHCKSTKDNKFVTIPEEEEEDSRDDNKHYKSSTNNHQLILNNNTSIFEAYDECPWLSDYRAIKIHSTMTPLEAYPHYQLQSIIPKFGQNLLCDYIKIAKEYKRMGKYRVRSNESKAADKLHCVNCSKKNAQLEKAFFPCEHKCVCRDCFEERRFEVCPLCKTEVKFTGNDHKEYQDWLDEYKAYLPATFIKKFQFGSKKAIQSAMADANEMKNPSQKAKSKFSMRPRLKFDFGQTKLSSSQHEKENSVKNERTLDNAGDANNNLSSAPNEYVYL